MTTLTEQDIGSDVNEAWRDIRGYKGIYQISSHGRVRSLSRSIKYKGVITSKEKIMKTFLKRGCSYVRLTDADGYQLNFSISRLVAEAFIPNPYLLDSVIHLDGNIQNNFIVNLDWAKRSIAVKRAWRMGLYKNAKPYVFKKVDPVSWDDI